MFQFKESINNPADELAYAKSLTVFLNDLTNQGVNELTFSKDGTLGLSIILEMICNIIDSVENKLSADKETI